MFLEDRKKFNFFEIINYILLLNKVWILISIFCYPRSYFSFIIVSTIYERDAMHYSSVTVRYIFFNLFRFRSMWPLINDLIIIVKTFTNIYKVIFILKQFRSKKKKCSFTKKSLMLLK